MPDGGYTVIIITEGEDDAKLIGAVLERKGWEKERGGESERTWCRGPHRVRVLPSERGKGGRANIPFWVRTHRAQTRYFIILFDPDEHDPNDVVADLWHKIWTKLNENLSESEDLSSNIKRVRDRDGWEGLLIFLSLMLSPEKFPDNIRNLIFSTSSAHNMMDYVLYMGLQNDVLQALLEKDSSLRSSERLSVDRFQDKFREILQLLRNQGVGIESSKRAMDFYHALLGYRAGLGKLGACMVQYLREETLNELFEEFLSTLEKILQSEIVDRS